MFPELVPDDHTVMDKGNVYAQGVLRRMHHQQWGLQAPCWAARISGVSTTSTTRENGISSEAAGESHQVSGGHMRLPQLNKLCMCPRFPESPVILLSFSQIRQKHIRQTNI